jgi:hypothetical protein
MNCQTTYAYQNFLTPVVNHLRYTVAQKPPLYAEHYRNQGPSEQKWRLANAVLRCGGRIGPSKTTAKIELAHKAIGNRMEDAMLGRLPIEAAERQAIEDSRYNLWFLKKHPAA